MLGQQANLFIETGFEEIEKHFRRWMNGLVFFGLALEPPVSEIVANRLLGQRMKHRSSSNQFYSEIHNRTINLRAFITFMKDQSDEAEMEKVCRSYYYNQYNNGIKSIANDGEKLWESTVKEVVGLREFIEDVVLGCASNQQFCELQIKESEHSQSLNRSDAVKSLVAIIRAYLNQNKAVLLEDRIEKHEFRANQYTTAGAKGERTMKKKTKEKDLASRTIIKGPMRTEALIKVVEELNKNETEEDAERIERIAKTLIDQQATNKKLMQEKIKTSYRDGKKKKKKRNELQKRRKIVLTDQSCGCIPFGKLNSNHMQGICEEIRARGGTPNEAIRMNEETERKFEASCETKGWKRV